MCDNLISAHQNSARGKQRAQLALLKYSHFFLAYGISATEYAPGVDNTSSVFLRKNIQGGKPMFRDIEGGHRSELKYINCESWLKLRGGKTIFRGEKLPPSNPLKTPLK